MQSCNIDGNKNNILAANCSTGETVDTSDNNVTLNSVPSGGKAPEYIYGAVSEDANVENNTVTINGGDTDAHVYGAYSELGGASGNSVVMTGGTVARIDGAGYSKAGAGGAVSDNTVTITGGIVKEDVTAGYAIGNTSHSVINNTVTISGASTVIGSPTYGNIHGGIAHTTLSGVAEGNKVIFNEATLIGGIWGAQNHTGNVQGNSVTINSGTVQLNQNANIFAGYTHRNATRNEIIITGGTINVGSSDSWIVGGRSDVDKLQTLGYNANNNLIRMSDGEVTGAATMMGGLSLGGNANSNKVEISGGTVGDTNTMVVAGYSVAGDSNSNTLTISDGTVGGVDSVFRGGYSGFGDANNNKVEISGGTVGGKDSGLTGGHSKSGDANNNKVEISGGTVGGVDSVFRGGYSGSGDANSNTFTISGGTVDGKDLTVGITNGQDGSANSNTLTISGGTVGGGKSILRGGYSDLGDATHNTVTISGGDIKGVVMGATVGGSGSATQNTVTIQGNPTISGAIYGGYGGPTAKDLRTGNTLNMQTKGIRAVNIVNFENLNFYLPADTKAGDVLLSLTSKSDTDIKNTKIMVDVTNHSLNTKNKVTLIHKENGKLLDDGATKEVKGQKGISTVYDFIVQKENDKDLVLFLKPNYDAKTNPKTKSLSEARLVVLDFINHSASQQSATALQDARTAGSSIFISTSGFAHKTKTGSYVKEKGFSASLGLGTDIKNGAGTLYVGGFFEFGKGTYDTYNAFSDGDVRADGKVSFYGAGVVAKQVFTNQFFVEGMVRVGRLKSSYNSDDLSTLSGEGTYFTNRPTYVGASLKLGKGIAMNQQATLTPYAKLAWTRYQGGMQTLAGDDFHFNSVNSVRSRLGVAVDYALNADSKFYTDIAWEHEFKGTTKANVNALNLAQPSLKGSTAILGMGVRYSPANNNNLSIDVNVNGHIGKRRGVDAGVSVGYKF